MAEHQKHSEAMTGRDLLELLKSMSDEELDRPVHFQHQAGDYWHTTLATEVQNVESSFIAYSGYHNNFQVLDEEKYDKAEREAREAGVDELEYSNQPIQHVLLIG